jgi:hypothetical protein
VQKDTGRLGLTRRCLDMTPSSEEKPVSCTRELCMAVTVIHRSILLSVVLGRENQIEHRYDLVSQLPT